jgi:hypothetical protein
MGERRHSSTTLDLGARWRWSGSRPGRFSPGVRAPGTHWIGGWVGSRAGLDTVEYRKICCNCRESNPGRPARSPSLYRLCYPGSFSILRLPRRYCILQEKRAVIISISEKANRDSVGNHRPVAILSALSKVSEFVIHEHISHHFKTKLIILSMVLSNHLLRIWSHFSTPTPPLCVFKVSLI